MQRIITTLLLSLLCGCLAVAQEVIRVTGKVTSKETGRALYGVNITDTDTKRLMAQTDEDGRFAMDVRSNTTLVFSMIGAEKVSVKVKKRNYIEVQMVLEDVFLNTADVVAKRIVNEVQPEQTDIELKGNYFHIKTRVRVPREMFGQDSRLVVQPVLNNVTTGEQTLMRPLVYDARTYNRTQARMYDFDLEGGNGDPLAKFITVKNDTLREKGRTNDIIGYTDSIYVKRVKDEYTCDVYMAIEDYHKICYRDTTVIARGTINPLRWLDYSFGSTEITDPALFPKAEQQLRDSKGEIDLRFPIGKATFDPQNPHNASEIGKLQQQILSVEQTPDAKLHALSIEGTSSPDGRYNSNLRLARQRMDFALDYLRGCVPEHLRRNMKFSSNAEVAGWDEVAKMLRADSLTDEAEQIEALIKRHKSPDEQGLRIRKLPFYRNLLEKAYLPRLRSVGYTMNYSIFRQLTTDEIRQLYQKDYRQLSRYEFFRLYREEADEQQREKMLRQALEIYPSFMVAANDLQALLIRRHASEPELLAPFAGKRAPHAVNINHAVALIANGLYTAADTVAAYIPETDDTRLILAVNGALNGRYKENYSTIAATGQQNELLMLLAMKRNTEALELCKQLPADKALTHYLMAVCLNRIEKPLEAYEELKEALKMDPSLEKTALVDGDVNNLLLDKDKKK